MNVETEIRDRVKGYITDHHRWAMKYSSGNPQDPFQGIDDRAAAAAIGTHLSPHSTPEHAAAAVRGSGLAWPPIHDPGFEDIDRIAVESPKKACAFTVRRSPEPGRKPVYFVFELVHADGRWLVAGVQRQFNDPNAIVARQPKLEDLARWHPQPIIADDYSDGIEQAFGDGASVVMPNGVHPVTRRLLGEITVSSGFLVCSDVGLWKSSSFILDRQVAPGRYPVEILIDNASQKVAAARVLFDAAATPEQRVCATRWERQDIPSPEDRHRIDSHHVATDTGTIGLIDAAALLPLSQWERERIAERLLKAGKGRGRHGSTVLDLNPNTNAVLLASGFGDGVYPAFWLLGSKGQPAQWFVDFGVLGVPVLRDVSVPFSLKRHEGIPKVQALDELKVGVTFFPAESGPALRILGGPAVQTFKAFDAKGKLLFEQKGMDSDIDANGQVFYYLPNDVPPNASGRLEIQFFLKSRYDLAR